MKKLKEKFSKLCKYIYLEILFSKHSEFKQIHPELMKLWKKKFAQMIRYSSKRFFPVVKEFMYVKLEKITECKVANDKLSPVLLCVIKDDFHKMKRFMEHYRGVGIRNFVFLDNMSTDGTYEFLLEQEDVTVYRCEHPYAADRKTAWQNRMIADIGINRWYLIVDSDEFVTYLGSTNHSIQDITGLCVERGYERLGGCMIDMYPRNALFNVEKEDDLFSEYIYFDKDGYQVKTYSNGMEINGGPRKRVFGYNQKLSKYPLFYFGEDDIVESAHSLIPYKKIKDTPMCLIILHYKFVDVEDYNKMIGIIKAGLYYNGAAAYKAYYAKVSEDSQISFYDEEHSLLFSEENIRKIDFIRDIFKDESEKIT